MKDFSKDCWSDRFLSLSLSPEWISELIKGLRFAESVILESSGPLSTVESFFKALIFLSNFCGIGLQFG